MGVCHALADARTLSEWHSHLRCHRLSDSKAARPDIRMLLRNQSHPRAMHLSVETICLLKVLFTV